MSCKYLSGLIGTAIGLEMKMGGKWRQNEREQIWRKEWLVEIQQIMYQADTWQEKG